MTVCCVEIKFVSLLALRIGIAVNHLKTEELSHFDSQLLCECVVNSQRMSRGLQ